MKNIQVIDGAKNAGYWIYAAPEKTFRKIFPEPNQDIEFVTDFFDRVGEEEAIRLLNVVWQRRVAKPHVRGIHGTLFYDLEFKRKYYPNKQEADLND